MSGRGRGGKRVGSSVPGPGPGRPPKYPREPQMELPQGAAQPVPALPPYILNVLNALAGDASRQHEFNVLVSRVLARQLSFHDFLGAARPVIGDDRLYGQLVKDAQNAAMAAGSRAAMANPMNPGGPVPLMNPQGVNAFRPPSYQMPYVSGAPSMAPMFPPSLLATQHQHQQQQTAVHASMSQLAAAAALPSIGISNPNEPDVTKMDTASLQDVIQYSGVDLRAEAEMMYREHEALGAAAVSGAAGSAVDYRMKYDYFFNAFKFRAIVQSALQRHFLSTVRSTNQAQNTSTSTSTSTSGLGLKPLGITEDAVNLLAHAIQRRLAGIVRSLVDISRHRVDYDRGRFKIKIENDPKKQLWLLEKLWVDGLASRGSSSGGIAAGGTASSNAATTNQNALVAPSMQTVLDRVPSTVTGSAAATADSKPKGTGDDVKTKLANVTALAALGVKQKSWMMATSDSASSSQTSASSNTGAVGDSSGNAGASNTAPGAGSSPSDAQTGHPLAAFYTLPSSTPLTDAELHAQYINRSITAVDLITLMESDANLRRSRLLPALYETLPRENKEYTASKDPQSQQQQQN